MTELLNTPDDMAWIREVHILDLDQRYHSAVIEGNEDAPDSITVYDSPDPSVTDVGMRFEPDSEGTLISELQGIEHVIIDDMHKMYYTIS